MGAVLHEYGTSLVTVVRLLNPPLLEVVYENKKGSGLEVEDEQGRVLAHVEKRVFVDNETPRQKEQDIASCKRAYAPAIL